MKRSNYYRINLLLFVIAILPPAILVLKVGPIVLLQALIFHSVIILFGVGSSIRDPSIFDWGYALRVIAFLVGVPVFIFLYVGLWYRFRVWYWENHSD